MRLVNHDIITIAGAGVAAILAPMALLWPSQSIVTSSPQARPTQFAGPSALALRGTVFEAPLFNQRRSPNVDEAAVADEIVEAAPVAPPKLVGTIAARAGRSVALVRDGAGETQTVRIGEEVNGWRLLSIGNGVATVEQAGRRETIMLDFSNKDQAINDTSLSPSQSLSSQAQTNTAPALSEQRQRSISDDAKAQ